MKARKIKKIRKKISTPGYWEERWNFWSKKSKELNTFYKFECSTTFSGDERAEYNYYIYKRDRDRVCAQCKWYKEKTLKQVSKK